MKTILLIRHGIAEDPVGPDAERALTPEGWEKTRAAMRGLVNRGYVPTRAYSSPYRRAAETLVCLQEAASREFPVGYWDGLVPSGSISGADDWLRAQLLEDEPEAVIALVSHQPFLGDLVFRLTGRELEIKKASCTVLLWDGRRFAFGAHFRPAELRAS